MSSGEVAQWADSSAAKLPGTAADTDVHKGARLLVEEAARTEDSQHRRQLLHQALILEIEGDSQYETLQLECTRLLHRISGEEAVDFELAESTAGQHLHDTHNLGVLSSDYEENSGRVIQANANQHREGLAALTPERGHSPKNRNRRKSKILVKKQENLPPASDSKLNMAVQSPVRVSVEVRTHARLPSEPHTPKTSGRADKMMLSPASSVQSGSSSRKKPRKLEVRSPKASPAKSAVARKKPKKLEVRSRG